MLETNLHPLTNPAAPGPAVPAAKSNGEVIPMPYNISFSFDTLQFSVNNATFTPPTVPVLLQILSGARTAQELLPKGSVYTLPPNKVIEITIPGGSLGAPVRTPCCSNLVRTVHYTHDTISAPYSSSWPCILRRPECGKHCLQLQQPCPPRRSQLWHQHR